MKEVRLIGEEPAETPAADDVLFVNSMVHIGNKIDIIFQLKSIRIFVKIQINLKGYV